MQNIIDNHVVHIVRGKGHPVKQIRDVIDDTPRWYSWVLYKDNENHYKLTYHVSQNDDYNTVDVGCAITNIVNCIAMTKRRQGIVGYEQPTLTVLVETMSPLINSLVNREAHRWKQFSQDDLTQICYLCLCELYRKGYYVHKALLKRTFTNHLYYQLRKTPRDLTLVSLTAPLHDGDDYITVQDTLPDIEQEYSLQDEENDIICKQIFAEQRELIIELIGKRRYDDLLREFRSKTLDNTASATLRRLRKMLIDKCYDVHLWDKYFS